MDFSDVPSCGEVKTRTSQAPRCRYTHSGILGGVRGGTPFSSQEKENIYILGNFEHFVAQKVP
jgi:hypothetical protein